MTSGKVFRLAGSILLAMLLLLPGNGFAASPKENGCCPTSAAPDGYTCPQTTPCDSGNGYCGPCWQEGIEKAREILELMQTEPGQMLYGPAFGTEQFNTFDGSEQFEGSIYGEKQQMYLVGGFSVCFLGVNTSGVQIAIRPALPPNFTTFGPPVTYQMSGVGRQGFAQCPSGVSVWDDVSAPGAAGQCQYFGWHYNPGTMQISAKSAVAQQYSSQMELAPFLAFDNFICVSPSGCNVTFDTVYLNWNRILNQISAGIMDAVVIQNSQHQVTPYSSGNLPAECMAFYVLAYENTDGKSPVVRCWHGEGQFVNCEDIAGLQNRSGGLFVVSPAEKLKLKESEKDGVFYENESTGMKIKSPAAAVLEEGEARTQFATSKVCGVRNRPFGSRETGWVNIVHGAILCDQHDWECIEDATMTICERFETDPDCRLSEEFIDGIPSVQFGNTTNFTGERLGTCWIDDYIPMSADDPALQEPDILQGTPYSGIGLAFKEDPARPQIWFKCGDFQIIERQYVCIGDRMVSDDSVKDQQIHQDRITSAAKAAKSSVSVDMGTGVFQSYTFDGVTRTPATSSGQSVTFGSEQPEDCPADEMSCIISYRGNDKIYGDGHTREEISPVDSQGQTQSAPQGLMVKKQVRKCDTNSQGMAVCPYDPSFETLEAGCGCQNLIGDAVAAISIARTLSHDVQCYDEASGEYQYTDQYMENVSNLRPEYCGGEGIPPQVDYFCAMLNESIPTGYSMKCASYLFARGTLDEVSLMNPPEDSELLPLQPIVADLVTDEQYQCRLVWTEDPNISITPGPIAPQIPWFDICYYESILPTTLYLEQDPMANFLRPPSDLCSPALPDAIGMFAYTGSREDGGCGWDSLEINSDPVRDNSQIGLYPMDIDPFGYTKMIYVGEREFDNYQPNSLDCNGDGWLECFSCQWRTAGYDCDEDCILDNDYTLCNRIDGIDCNADAKIDFEDCPIRFAGRDCSGDCIAETSNAYLFCPSVEGWDCTGNNAVDYASCVWRNSGYDCNRDSIADNNVSLCNEVSGYDCNGDNVPDYSTCTYRAGGYDFDGDCLSDSSDECITSSTYCGTTWDYSGLGSAINSTYSSMAVGDKIEGWGCGYTVTRTTSGFDIAGITLSVTGSNYTDGVNAVSAYYGLTCGIWDGYNTAPGTCCGSPVSEGYDCFGTACADGCNFVGYRDCDQNGSVDNDITLCPFMESGYDCFGTPETDPACRYIAGTDCGINGGSDGNFTPDGRIDNNANYCPMVQAGYDCYPTNGYCADSGCEHISGYDCGTNGGPIRNQTPDQYIDNQMQYCAYVEEGWDCSGSSCDGNSPAYSGYSNNGIAGSGTCSNPEVLADLECQAGTWSCSRKDEPGRCGYETVDITFEIPIRNKGDNDYKCYTEDPDTAQTVHEFNYPDEQRFLPEGCRDALNEIYYEGSVPLVDFGLEVPFQYIRYEDLIDKVARSRCEWRDPLSMASCEETPYQDVNRPDYIYIEDMSNSSLKILP